MSAMASTLPVVAAVRRVRAAVPARARLGSATIAPARRASAIFVGAHAAKPSRRRAVALVTRAAAEEGVGDKVVNAQGSAEEEAAGLAAVRAKLDASDGCPPCEDETVIWFLRDRKMDVDATAEKLEGFLRWRADVGDITEDQIAPSLASNAAYVHPHLDKEGRAVIVVEIAKHMKDDRDLDSAKLHAVWAVEKCLKMMEESPAGSGGIYAVWDMRGFSGANADLDLAKFCILDVFRKYYPKRLEQVAAVDSPWAFKPIWAILKPIIGKYSSVVKFCKTQDVLDNFEEGKAPACLTR